MEEYLTKTLWLFALGSYIVFCLLIVYALYKELIPLPILILSSALSFIAVFRYFYLCYLEKGMREEESSL